MVSADVVPVEEIERESPSPWDLAQIHAELANSASISLVAENTESTICGWCCARYYREEAELLKIAVRKSIRRQGVGGWLLRSLKQLLIQQSVSAIFLEVRSLNDPALRLYIQQGFEVVGKRPGYYSNPTDDALICQFHASHVDNF